MSKRLAPAGLFLAWAGRLRFPWLLAITATAFVVDLFVPDFIPFADEVLLGLARDRYDGALEFVRDEVCKRVLWQRGLPVMAESNLSGESLATALLERSLIDRAQHAKIVEATRRARGLSEGAAVLAMECVDPVALVGALREVIRRRILECFEWTRGSYREVEEIEVP